MAALICCFSKARAGAEEYPVGSLDGKRIAPFSGYHHAFAAYNMDKQYLRRAYNAIITFSQKRGIGTVCSSCRVC